LREAVVYPSFRAVIAAYTSRMGVGLPAEAGPAAGVASPACGGQVLEAVGAAERDGYEVVCGRGGLAAPVAGRVPGEEDLAVAAILGGLGRETRRRAALCSVIRAVTVACCESGERLTTSLTRVVRHEANCARRHPVSAARHTAVDSADPLSMNTKAALSTSSRWPCGEAVWRT